MIDIRGIFPDRLLRANRGQRNSSGWWSKHEDYHKTKYGFCPNINEVERIVKEI